MMSRYAKNATINERDVATTQTDVKRLVSLIKGFLWIHFNQSRSFLLFMAKKMASSSRHDIANEKKKSFNQKD